MCVCVCVCVCVLEEAVMINNKKSMIFNENHDFWDQRRMKCVGTVILITITKWEREFWIKL